MLAPLAADAGLVTLVDGHPATLSWLGAVRGQRQSAAAPSSTRLGRMVRQTKSATREGDDGSGGPWQSEMGGSRQASLSSRHTTFCSW